MGYIYKLKKLKSADQKTQILNIDEHCLSLDSSPTQSGQRPTITFINGGLPYHELVVNKTSQSTKLIAGSADIEEIISQDIQF